MSLIALSDRVSKHAVEVGEVLAASQLECTRLTMHLKDVGVGILDTMSLFNNLRYDIFELSVGKGFLKLVSQSVYLADVARIEALEVSALVL